MALGASAARVQLAIVSQTLRLTLIGIAIGSAASFVAARAIASLLFGTEPADPLIFSATMFMLAGVALIAGLLPARRASRIDPIRILRAV